MKPIKFIDNLSFSPDGELVSAGSSYRGSAIFMRQGDLDGACAIYSLMMLLIMNHRINRRELVTRDKNPGYTSTKRLQDEFLGDLPGLYKDGFFFNDLGDKLSSSYKKVASAITFSTYVEREFINQHANRCSSGIVLILSQVPFIEVKDKPRKALYVKRVSNIQ